MFELVQEALQTATALALAELATESGTTELGAEESVQLNDLRNEVNIFELVGPKSTAVLQGVLNLVHGGNSPDSVDVCEPSISISERFLDHVPFNFRRPGIVCEMSHQLGQFLKAWFWLSKLMIPASGMPP